MTESTTDWFSEEAATFGDRLAAAREGAGMDQLTLATKLGVREATLLAWEEDTKEPRANRLQMLSGLLNVSLRWLLTGQGEGPDEPSEAVVDPDLTKILAEMRSLRAEMTLSVERFGQLEKRLRKIINTT